MRSTIRVPADVEIATELLRGEPLTNLEGATAMTIESVPNGKFNKVTKISIALPSLGEVIVITPKERK